MKEKILIVVCLVLVLFAGWRLVTSDMMAFGEVQPGMRVMDIDTGHRFTIQLDRDFRGWPVKSPKTGKMTGYPVEVCYWNECGKTKGGTWVVLNEYLGNNEPTSCPVCGHEVGPHNPLPPGHYVDREGYLRPDTSK